MNKNHKLEKWLKAGKRNGYMKVRGEGKNENGVDVSQNLKHY